MTKYNSAKQAELAEIALEYQNYKGLRAIKKQELQTQLEREMTEAREQFSSYLQSKVDREGYPYRIYIADIMRAMNTTNRGTVLGFVKDARARAEKRRIENFINTSAPVEILHILADDPGAHQVVEMWVATEDLTYHVWYRNGDGGAGVVRYQQDVGYLNEGYGWVQESTGQTFQRRLPLGSDTKDRGAVPEWLEYAVSLPEWTSLATNFK